MGRYSRVKPAVVERHFEGDTSMKHPLIFSVLPLARLATAVAALVTVTLHPAIANDNDYDGNWHYALTPYVWLPGVSGDLNFRPARFPNVTASVNIDEGPLDVLKHFRFGLMGTATVRKGEWSAFTDTMYVSLSGDKAAVRTVTGPLGIVEIPVNVGTTLDIKDLVSTNGIGYSLYHDDITEADAFVGFRYAGVWTDLNWRFSVPLLQLSRTGSASAHEDAWDAIIGMRGRYGFPGTPWFIPAYFDIGTGDSDVTLQASVGGGYAFRWGDVSVAYRYLYYKPGGVVDNLSLHGVTLAATFHL